MSNNYTTEQFIQKAIEVHGFTECVFSDSIKNTFCYDNSIKLIRIKYTNYEEIENILINSIS